MMACAGTLLVPPPPTYQPTIKACRRCSSYPPKWAAARLVGFDGPYLRFAGELRIEHYKGEQLVESHVDDALWELMYFGKARP